MAILAFERGDRDRAERLLGENLSVARDIGNLVVEATSLFELGIVSLRLAKNYDSARRYFVECLELSELAGFGRNALKCRLYLADIEQERGHHEEAIEQFERCVTDAAKVEDAESECWALARRARSLAITGDLAKAKDDLDRASAIARRLGLPILGEIEGLLALIDSVQSGR